MAQDSRRRVVGRPAVVRTPSTVVTHIYPSGDVVPANQLRMYLHFSAPMDWRSGYDYVKLLDERGEEVVDAFLPLDADFWNDDRTRYTVFFDPGRVKRGILPNKQMGRALDAGKRYTLVVKREWRDGHGMPLKEEFRHQFRASESIERPLTMSDWKSDAAAAGTRDPLADCLSRRRSITGCCGERSASPGAAPPSRVSVAIEAGETRWLFTPRDPWAAGDYDVVALAFLEDLAGNRIGRAFEVDNFERTDLTPEPEKRTLGFTILPLVISGASRFHQRQQRPRRRRYTLRVARLPCGPRRLVPAPIVELCRRDSPGPSRAPVERRPRV